MSDTCVTVTDPATGAVHKDPNVVYIAACDPPPATTAVVGPPPLPPTGANGTYAAMGIGAVAVVIGCLLARWVR